MNSSSIPRFLSSWVQFKNPNFSLSYTTISSAEKYLTQLQKNGNSMPSSSIPCFLSSWVRFKTPKFSHSYSNFATFYADKYWTQLQKNGPNPEKCLDEVESILDKPCVKEVLRRCAPNQPLLGLRFFVWAGLQRKYKHTSSRYSKVCKLFEITRNPHLIKDVIEAYRVEGCEVRVKTFRIVLNLCWQADLADEGLWVLRKMKEFSCRPDREVYNVGIRYFCEKGEMDVADGLLREMALIDVSPDMIIYVAMLKGFFDVGRLEDACGLFKYLREHGSRFVTQAAYPMLMDGLCRLSTLERTLELMEAMWTEDGQCIANTYTYTAMIGSLCENGRSMEALQVLDRMVACGCAPDRDTLETLIWGFMKEGRLEEAYKVTDKVVAGGSVSKDECYSCLMKLLLEYPKVEEAEKLSRRMLASDIKPDFTASNLLIRKLCLEWRVLDAFRFCDETQKLGYSTTIDDRVYSPLLAGLCEGNRLVEAGKVAKTMIERRIQLVAPYKDNVTKSLRYAKNKELTAIITKLKRLR